MCKRHIVFFWLNIIYVYNNSELLHIFKNMKKFNLHHKNFSRRHFVNPNSEEIESVSTEFDLHEIVVEDIIDSHTQDKVDKYDDHIFFVIHFPYFEPKKKRYITYEINVLLIWKILITFSNSEIQEVDNLRSERESWSSELDHSYLIIYTLIDDIYTGVSKSLTKFNRWLFLLEEEMFENEVLPKYLLESLMVKRRNAITLKHIFTSHSEILWELHSALKDFSGDESDVYFEDLEFKIDKITNIIQWINENITSISETYNTLMSIRTNSVVGYLTVITVVIWFLTLISGMYGMNITLPFQDSPYFFRVLLTLMIILIVWCIWYFRKLKWI